MRVKLVIFMCWYVFVKVIKLITFICYMSALLVTMYALST